MGPLVVTTLHWRQGVPILRELGQEDNTCSYLSNLTLNYTLARYLTHAHSWSHK